MADLLRPDGVAVRLATMALWLFVVTGPVLGVAALLIVRTPEPPSTDTVVDLPAPVAALAELAVLAHLSGAPLEPTRLTPSVVALRQAPDSAVENPDGVRDEALDASLGRPALGAAVISHESAGPDRFGVQVLVLDRAGQVETWQVTINQSPDGPSVEGLPALVPSFDAPSAPSLGISAPQQPTATSEVGGAVEGFLRGLLVGDVDLQRYTAAGFIPPGDASPASGNAAVTEVTLRRLGVQQVGTRLAVLAEVAVWRLDGRRHVMQYPLLLSRDQGRWEVLRVLPALPLTSDTTQTP